MPCGGQGVRPDERDDGAAVLDELFNYLQEAPYNIEPEKLEFFRIHGIVDVDHATEAGEAVARLIRDDRDIEMVRHMAETQVRLKHAKFEGIYDAYA